MKILCGKCNKPLTQDLYPVNYKHFKDNKTSKRVWDLEFVTDTIEFSDHTEEHTTEIYTFKRGVFIIKPVTSKYNWSVLDIYGEETKKDIRNSYPMNESDLSYYRVFKREPKKLIVGGKSVLDNIIPPFKTGYGCCNYSAGKDLHCECGNLLGGMFLDCYESGVVEFIDKNIRRSYDIIPQNSRTTD